MLLWSLQSGISQLDPEKWAWRSCVPQTVVLHKKGRQHEMHEYHEAVGFETSILQTSQSTHVHKGWKHELEDQHPHKSLLHNQAKEAHRGQWFCTSDIPAHWLLCHCDVPSCDSHEHDHSWGMPKAASLLPHLYGWCWEMLKCLTQQDTAVWRRLSPVAELQCVSEWECGTVHLPFSTEGWLHTGQWESHLVGRWSHFLPSGRTQG